MLQPSLFDPPPRVRTVSEINTYIRQKFDADLNLQDVWLEGEISNWKQAASGHIYFTLKDSSASIRCVVWRSQAERLMYLPQRDGEAVLAHGKVSVYEAGGNYQFYVDNLEPAGQGALYAQFERIKAQLAAEGLFAPELKQPLPPFPQTIGVITSPDAAALRDILNVLRRRYSIGRVILSPTPVQGESAPPQIIKALDAVIAQRVDVIILARGGGSLEDLWAFNSEALARSIAACPIPLVTGVGHETDFTIADFVADLRASTPSAAAELVTPDRVELKRHLYDLQLTLVEETRQIVTQARQAVQQRVWALARVSPQTQINNQRQQVDMLTNGLIRSVGHHLMLQRQHVEALNGRLAVLNPEATLKRGYAIVQKGKTAVTHTKQVKQGDILTVKIQDGQFDVTAN